MSFPDCAVSIHHCVVDGGLAGVHVLPGSSLSFGSTNLDADPLFVAPAAGDYHLLPCSPCIDAGHPAYWPATGERDLDGEPRVQGFAIGIGADES